MAAGQKRPNLRTGGARRHSLHRKVSPMLHIVSTPTAEEAVAVSSQYQPQNVAGLVLLPLPFHPRRLEASARLQSPELKAPQRARPNAEVPFSSKDRTPLVPARGLPQAGQGTAVVASHPNLLSATRPRHRENGKQAPPKADAHWQYASSEAAWTPGSPVGGPSVRASKIVFPWS
jgi:hypothetical protein